MSKNILVLANYKLKSFYHEGNVSDYTAIGSICYRSFMENLEGLDEIIVFTGSVANYNIMFRDKFYRLRDLHTKEKCNILYVDLDTVCVKQTKLFGLYNNFNVFYMCNDLKYRKYTSEVPLSIYKHLNPWFMVNVQYYPYNMDMNLWNVGSNLADKWINVWAYECIIYNAMLHAQGINVKSTHNPKFNYQYLKEFNMDIPLSTAHIIHVPATRGSRSSLKIMEKLFYGC